MVADGASTDATHDILTRRSAADRRLRWQSEPDSGPADAINKALARSRGTLIGWLNADDRYTEQAIEHAVLAFNANPQWLLHYGHGQHIDAAGKVLNEYPTKHPQTPIEAFAHGCFICQPTLFFKRAVLSLVGNLDEKWQTSFDFDYWLRAFKLLPGRIGFVDRVQAQSRLHPDCITRKQRRTIALEAIHLLHLHLGVAPLHWLHGYAGEAVAMSCENHSDDRLTAQLSETLELASEWLSDDDQRTFSRR